MPKEIAQTWVSMCPAQVYEIPEDQLENGTAEVDVHVTASNCVQCGAITAKGGRLTLPEGGDGPLYKRPKTPKAGAAQPSPDERPEAALECPVRVTPPRTSTRTALSAKGSATGSGQGSAS